MRCWQDMDKTIPAVNDGDPVAVVEPGGSWDGRPSAFIQRDPLKRPVLRVGHEPWCDLPPTHTGACGGNLD